jgi:signal transduction histidine kinase
MESTGNAGVLTTVNLLELPDISSVIDALLELLKSGSQGGESFVVLSNAATGQLRFDSVRSSSSAGGYLGRWLGAHFEKHPALTHKLLRSELVALASVDAGINSQPPQGIRANVVLAPVLFDCRLIAAFGLASQADDVPPQGPDCFNLEYVRACAIEAAAPLARLLELDSLRRENRKSHDMVRKLETVEAECAALGAKVAQLEAMAVMRAHLHANVAHEMRTPLAAARGYTRMVLDGRPGELNRIQREYLEVAIENTNKLIHLVNWVVRTTEKGEKMALSSVEVRDLWRECISKRAWELGSAGISIEEVGPIPHGPVRILADRSRMQRTFDHLIRAALQFTESGTVLKLEFSRPRKGGISMKLSGMNRPMPAEATEFPFCGPAQDSFSELHEIISMHGGRFYIRRTAEEGSVLMFTLPAISNESADVSAGRQSA